MEAWWVFMLASVVLLLFFGTFLKRRKAQLFRLLFPVGYFLYARTRLGYYHHLRRLRNRSNRLHSIVEPVRIRDITIYPLAILEDNYSYLIVDTNNVAVVVDPADPMVVENAVKEHGVHLKAILTTHKHWDHAGGNEGLKQRFPCLTVYGGKLDNPSGTTFLLEDKDNINIGALHFTALLTPGHTTGHMVYQLSSSPPCLFSGDHLFIGGCGRIFEGTAQQMLDSLNLIKKLDPSTFIFPGHEYTHSNLTFAAFLEPDSTAVKEKLSSAKQLRARRLATVPATLEEELQYNPFLRTDSSRLRTVLGFSAVSNQADVLAELRRRKNAFIPS